MQGQGRIRPRPMPAPLSHGQKDIPAPSLLSWYQRIFECHHPQPDVRRPGQRAALIAVYYVKGSSRDAVESDQRHAHGDAGKPVGQQPMGTLPAVCRIDCHDLVVHPRWGCGRNSVAACSRRVRTAPLSSLTGLAFVPGPGSPAINRWAILYRPAGLDCVMAELRDTAKLKAIPYCPSGLGFASVLLRRPVRPTGAIGTSPPFRRWVR